MDDAGEAILGENQLYAIKSNCPTFKKKKNSHLHSTQTMANKSTLLADAVIQSTIPSIGAQPLIKMQCSGAPFWYKLITKEYILGSITRRCLFNIVVMILGQEVFTC